MASLATFAGALFVIHKLWAMSSIVCLIAPSSVGSEPSFLAVSKMLQDACVCSCGTRTRKPGVSGRVQRPLGLILHPAMMPATSRIEDAVMQVAFPSWPFPARADTFQANVTAARADCSSSPADAEAAKAMELPLSKSQPACAIQWGTALSLVEAVPSSRVNDCSNTASGLDASGRQEFQVTEVVQTARRLLHSFCLASAVISPSAPLVAARLIGNI